MGSGTQLRGSWGGPSLRGSRSGPLSDYFGEIESAPVDPFLMCVSHSRGLDRTENAC